MRSNISALIAGLLFAFGLVLSGMTQPAKVVGFLDFAGDWDPTLVFVMGGGVLTYMIAFRLIRRRQTPAFANAFSVPQNTTVDAKLIGGAALFGVGWGLGGLCPGPAFVGLAGGSSEVATFAVFMVGGFLLKRVWDERKSANLPSQPVPNRT